MPAIFIHSFRVPPEAIDTVGHVGNVEYVRWMQDVAMAHSAAQGWPMERYAKTGAGWVVRSHAIEYRRPAFKGQLILLATWIADFQRMISLRKYLFIRGDDEQVIARGDTRWVFVEYATGAPARIPGELEAAFEVVTDADASAAVHDAAQRGTASG